MSASPQSLPAPNPKIAGTLEGLARLARNRFALAGLALVIVRATQPAAITLTAHSDGLKDATLKISAQ